MSLKPSRSRAVVVLLEVYERAPAVASGEPDLCAKAVDALDDLLQREDWPDPTVPRAEANYTHLQAESKNAARRDVLHHVLPLTAATVARS